MNISYEKLIETIFKTIKGMNYNIRMFDSAGNGPIANPILAKRMEVTPKGEKISTTLEFPSKDAVYEDKILIFIPAVLDDKNQFFHLTKRIKGIAETYGIDVDIKTLAGDAKNAMFAHRIKADKEEEAELDQEIAESILDLSDYL